MVVPTLRCRYPLQHFREDSALLEKLESIIEHANRYLQLTPNERNAAVEVRNMYQMRTEAQEDQCPVMQLKLCKDPIHLVSEGSFRGLGGDGDHCTATEAI